MAHGLEAIGGCMIQDRLYSITLQKLRIFAAVARERSFARAADSVFLSSPTVSDQIRSLENLVGMKLLHRSRGRGTVELTEAGEILFESYNEIIASIQKADKALAAIKHLERGTVELGTALPLIDHLLPVIYNKFHQAQPGIEVHVHVDEYETILEGLARRQLDMAIMLGPDDPMGLVWEPLFPTYMVPVGPPGHRLAGVSPVPFRELAHERLILGDRTSYVRKVLEQMAAEAGISLNVVLEVSNGDARLQSVLRGLGITVLSTLTVAPQITTGKLCLLQVQGFPKTMDCFIVHPSDRLSPSTQALKEYLVRSKGVLNDISASSERLISPQPRA